MFRLWGKIIKRNNIIADKVFELNEPGLSLEEKVDKAMEDLCYHFDIQQPLWIMDNQSDFSMMGKTRFSEGHFMEPIRFDFFEIEVIEDK